MTVRVTTREVVKPVLVACTTTRTLGSFKNRSRSPDATRYDQVARVEVPEVAEGEGTTTVVRPPPLARPSMTSRTVTPASVPVSPEIANPSAFSAMLIVLSPAMGSTFSVRVPTGRTVTVTKSVASL